MIHRRFDVLTSLQKIMAEHYAVPDRVSAGSDNIAPTMEDYRRVHAESMANPDSFWLGITKELIEIISGAESI